MVDAVVLVLREILEAAFIISLLMALGRKLKVNNSWVPVSILGGFFGSWLLAHFAYDIADMLEGTGQELLNSFLYLVVVVGIVILSLALLRSALLFVKSPLQEQFPEWVTDRHFYLIGFLFFVIVSFSVSREGAEIWIYLSGFTQQKNLFYPALVGAIIGSGIGVSLGAITYYLLLAIPVRIFLPTFLLVMTLLAGGLSMQLAKQLMQIGLLESSAPLWDTSFLVSEQSWFGELLYALLGYDAKPTPTQIVFYILAVAPVIFGVGKHYWTLRAQHHE